MLNKLPEDQYHNDDHGDAGSVDVVDDDDDANVEPGKDVLLELKS